MKCELTELEGLKRQLNIQLSTEQVQDGFQENYKKWQKKIQVSGFRKGKAPFEFIRSTYYNEIVKETLKDLLNEFYFKALEQNQLRPASQPVFDFKSKLKEGEDFQFSAVLEIQPSITIDKTFKAQLKKPSEDISEEEVEHSVEHLRAGFTKLEPVTESRGITWGDIAECKLTELTTPKLGITKKQMLEIKKQDNLPITGLLEGLLNMKPGETRKITVTFSNNYPNKELTGKSADWEIHLVSIKKKILPELNDEFASQFKCKNINELKANIQKSLQRDKQIKAHEEMKKQALEQFTKAHPIPFLPEEILEKQTQDIMNSHTKYLKSLNKKDQEIEIYNQKNKDTFRKQAVFEVHYSYLLFALADQLNLSVKPYEIQMYLQNSKQGSNKDPSTQERAKNFLICEKAIDHLIKTADIQKTG